MPASQAVSSRRVGGYFETLPERLGAVGLVILTAIEGLLGMRFLLHAFGANPNSGFVEFIDDVSWAFARPFADVFSNRSWSEGIIEVSTLVAMGFYLVLFAIIGMLVTALAPRLTGQRTARPEQAPGSHSSRTERDSTMDAIKMIKDDHHRMKELLRAYADAGNDAFKVKQEIANQVFAELEVHQALEEEIFYPAVRAKADDAGKSHVAEGVEEHHVVSILIGELKVLTPEDEVFAAKFKVLSEHVEHHMKEEEDDLLPDAKKKLGHDGIEVLGEQMDSRRKELQPAVAAT